MQSAQQVIKLTCSFAAFVSFSANHCPQHIYASQLHSLQHKTKTYVSFPSTV